MDRRADLVEAASGSEGAVVVVVAVFVADWFEGIAERAWTALRVVAGGWVDYKELVVLVVAVAGLGAFEAAAQEMSVECGATALEIVVAKVEAWSISVQAMGRHH